MFLYLFHRYLPWVLIWVCTGGLLLGIGDLTLCSTHQPGFPWGKAFVLALVALMIPAAALLIKIGKDDITRAPFAEVMKYRRARKELMRQIAQLTFSRPNYRGLQSAVVSDPESGAILHILINDTRPPHVFIDQDDDELYIHYVIDKTYALYMVEVPSMPTPEVSQQMMSELVKLPRDCLLSSPETLHELAVTIRRSVQFTD